MTLGAWLGDLHVGTVSPIHVAAGVPGAAVRTGRARVDEDREGDPKGGTAEPRLELPDGTSAAALNDVHVVAPLAWGDRPWSRIVGREWHDGVEWYRHADGSYTTTRMVWRSDLGRDDAVTLCVHPLAAAPAELPRKW